MDKNEDGQPTRQRWRISEPAVTVDFLIEPDDNAEAQAGRLFPLTRDWAAIIAPGLHLAFSNNQMVTMDGRTIVGETARRTVRVCGAGAFVVLLADNAVLDQQAAESAFGIRRGGEDERALIEGHLFRRFARANLQRSCLLELADPHQQLRDGHGL